MKEAHFSSSQGVLGPTARHGGHGGREEGKAQEGHGGGRSCDRSEEHLSGQVKQDIAQFFKNCTSESLRWRQNVRRVLTLAPDAVEFRYWSRIALEYGFGTPSKFTPEGERRESLVFVTTNGLYPWDDRADSMKSITDRMLSEKAAEEKLNAIEAKAEPVGADKTDRDFGVPETLEVVDPPPSPGEFGGRR